MLRARISRIRKELQEYQKKYPVVVVVSHYHILGFLMDGRCTADGDLAINILNCHPYYTTIAELPNMQ
jgi:hypothetical protein